MVNLLKEKELILKTKKDGDQWICNWSAAYNFRVMWP